MKETVEAHREEIMEWKRQLRLARQNVSQLQQWKIEHPIVAKQGTMADKIAGSIDQYIKHMQGQTTSPKNIANAVADAVFQPSLLDGKVLETVVERSIQSICFNTYTPLKLLRVMDMAGGQLSITGVEVARRVQAGGKKYFRGSILSCHATFASL